MKTLKWGAGALLALGAIACVNVNAQEPVKKPNAEADKKPMQAEIDKLVKDFKLKDLTKELKDGEPEDKAFVSLSQFKNKKPVVLFFMSEKCSVTWKYEKRVGELVSKYGGKDVQFFGVRCSGNDTEESIVKFAESKNFGMPVLNDAKGEVARYFKVQNTPTFVMIDKKGTYRYFGSFDDKPEVTEVKTKYLPNAIAAVLSGKAVPMKETRPFG
jgi:peroxiredoxin